MTNEHIHAKATSELGQGEGCECDWVDDAHAYDWTHCPVHFEAQQAAYEAYQRRTAAWLAVCRERGVNPWSPEGRQLKSGIEVSNESR